MSALDLDPCVNIGQYFTPPRIGAEKRGKSMKITPPAHHPGEPLAVSIDEAGRLVGLSPVTLRRRHRDGALPFVRLGRRTLVRVEDLRRMLETGGNPPKT